MQVLYILLLAGSLAFGLEALLLGLGGQLAMLYRRRKFRTLGLASSIGLAITGLAILTSAAFGFELLYPCVLALVYMLVAGKAIGALKPKLKAPSPFPCHPSHRRKSSEQRSENVGLESSLEKRRRVRFDRLFAPIF